MNNEDDENPMADIMRIFQFGGPRKPEKEGVLSYSEQELLFLARENNLKGIGVQNDPIIIETSNIFYEKDIIYIYSLDLHLKIQGCNFKSIRLKKMSNLNVFLYKS